MKEQHSIGGYFSLELPLRALEYHTGGVSVNSGKNAFEYILGTYGFRVKKVYLPYYTSLTMTKPLQTHNIPYEFYHINEDLELAKPIKVNDYEFIVYTNYFGLKGTYINQLAAEYGERLVVDNAQAFYDKPLSGINTFYSPRKFFGVLDGGYAYTLGKKQFELENSISYDRMGYLLKRIDTSAEDAYFDYKMNSILGEKPVQKMSKITQRILGSIDYDNVATVRRMNYSFLSDMLSVSNGLCLDMGDSIPLVYPYLCDDIDLRKKLISEQIYVAQYWPNVLDWCNEGDLEYYLTTHIIPLPIDQRYGIEDMLHIISIIKDK